MFNMIILDESSLNLVETVTAPSHRPLSPIIGREQQL